MAKLPPHSFLPVISIRNHEKIEAALSTMRQSAQMANPTKERSQKIRLDKLLVDQGHAASRERAQALILAGRVLVDEQRIDKPGTSISATAQIRLLGSDLKYVSRGGLKLEHALAHWSISLAGLPCIDIGASTGGFTDCMLQSGARSVLAVDTGYGQIAQKLRDDPRVTLLERTNARLLTPGELLTPAQPIPAFLAMDVSFISATLVLPAVLHALSTPNNPWQGEAVILIKPQFEAGRENIAKRGIVRDPQARQAAIDRVRTCVLEQHGAAIEIIDSPIQGMEGNHEYLLHAHLRGTL
jgi:23S rRNA (cytidine1920-2'-O)/16S rRNA (cytidine1409-2'-O)-methyltransferase